MKGSPRTVFVLVAVLLTLGTIPGTVWAGINVWTSLGPDGGRVDLLAVDPKTPGTVYAGNWGAGIFKSTNGGTTWVRSGLTQVVSFLVIDPETPSTLYAGTGVGMSKSMDGGASWSEVNLKQLVKSLVIDPQNASALYARTVNGVFKSDDGAASWVDTGLPPALALAIDPLNPKTLYVGTDGEGAFKSTDGGTSWSAVNSGLRATDITALAVDPHNAGTLYVGTRNSGLFKSTDAGTTWSAVNTGLPPIKPVSGTGYVEGLAIDPQNPNTVYAVISGGLFKSTDGGAIWSAASPGLPGTYVRSLVMDPQNPNTLFAGTNTGLFQSADAGTNWSTANPELPTAYVFASSLAIYPQNSSIQYAGFTSCHGLCDTRLFKSLDGGRTWNATALSFRPNPWGWIIVSLAVGPQNPDTIYMVVDHQNDEWDLFKSTDGGETWTAVKYGVFGVASDPQDSNTLYTVAGSISRSPDGGASWEPMNAGLPSPFSAKTLAMDPQNPKRIYAGTYGGLFAITLVP